MVSKMRSNEPISPTYNKTKKEIERLRNRCAKAVDLKNLDSIKKSRVTLILSLEDKALQDKLETSLEELDTAIKTAESRLNPKNTKKIEPVLPANTSTEAPNLNGETLVFSSKGVEIWDVPPVSVHSEKQQEEVADEPRIAAEAEIQKEKDARVKELEAFDNQVRLLKAKTQVPVAVELARALEQLSTNYKDGKLENRSHFIEQVKDAITTSIDELAKHRQQIPIIGPMIRAILNALRSLCSFFGNNSFFKTDSMKKVDSLLVVVKDMEKDVHPNTSFSLKDPLDALDAVDNVDENSDPSSNLTP